MKDALMLLRCFDALRPLQWFKNAFVFAPLFFSNNLLNKEYFIQTFWTFLAFASFPVASIVLTTFMM